MAKKSHVLIAALLACLGASACNTVSGVGQDLQALGSAMTNAAEDKDDNHHAARHTAPHAAPAPVRPATPAAAPAARPH